MGGYSYASARSALAKDRGRDPSLNLKKSQNCAIWLHDGKLIGEYAGAAAALVKLRLKSPAALSLSARGARKRYAGFATTFFTFTKILPAPAQPPLLEGGSLSTFTLSSAPSKSSRRDRGVAEPAPDGETPESGTSLKSGEPAVNCLFPAHPPLSRQSRSPASNGI